MMIGIPSGTILPVGSIVNGSVSHLVPSYRWLSGMTQWFLLFARSTCLAYIPPSPGVCFVKKTTKAQPIQKTTSRGSVSTGTTVVSFLVCLCVCWLFLRV